MGDLVFTLKKDWKEINRLHPNRKFLLAAVFAGVFVLSLVVGGMLFGRSSSLTGMLKDSGGAGGGTQETVPTQTPTTKLSLSPSSGTLKKGEATEVSVMLDGVSVTAADVVVSFDPKLVTVSKPVNGAVFSKVIRSVVEAGKIRYSASVSPEDSKKTPQGGTVFTFTVTPKVGVTTAEISLQFDPVDTITALEGVNTLGTTVGGVYTISK